MSQSMDVIFARKLAWEKIHSLMLVENAEEEDPKCRKYDVEYMLTLIVSFQSFVSHQCLLSSLVC